MEKRSIDLGRCLVRDGKADCHRCEEICPQRAITSHAVDQEACDGCGLCTAVCPAAAIEAPEDYAEALKKTMALTPQVLMCGKASPGGVHCLGFLDRLGNFFLGGFRPAELHIVKDAALYEAAVLEHKGHRVHQLLLGHRAYIRASDGNAAALHVEEPAHEACKR